MTDEGRDRDETGASRGPRQPRLSSSAVVWIGVAVVALIIVALLVVVALQ